jgi:hypothetical protein
LSGVKEVFDATIERVAPFVREDIGTIRGPGQALVDPPLEGHGQGITLGVRWRH